MCAKKADIPSDQYICVRKMCVVHRVKNLELRYEYPALFTDINAKTCHILIWTHTLLIKMPLSINATVIFNQLPNIFIYELNVRSDFYHASECLFDNLCKVFIWNWFLSIFRTGKNYYFGIESNLVNVIIISVKKIRQMKNSNDLPIWIEPNNKQFELSHHLICVINKTFKPKIIYLWNF